METIANLIKNKEKSFAVQIMNIQKQSGAADCSLYAMAVATCPAFNEDPTTIIFDQNQLRTHYAMTIETGKLALFPTTKKRRPKDRVLATLECLIYCDCRLPESGLMVCCSGCSEWFHQECIAKNEIIPNDIDNWIYLCMTCKMKESDV